MRIHFGSLIIGIPLLLAFLIVCSSTAGATTWYFSSTGSDSNSGTSSSPWQNPGYHNCSYQPGDVLQVAAGTYNATYGWQLTASGSATGGYITLQCAPYFDTKLIESQNSLPAIAITQGASYWDIRGCDVTSTGQDSSGIAVDGEGSTPFGALHHIIIEGNVLHDNSCGGITVSGNNNINGDTAYPVDYITIRNNVVFGNATTSSYHCSGISIYEPIKYDSASGYHIIIQGNTTYGNSDCDSCGTPTDGNGIILDDYMYTQNSVLSTYYGSYNQTTLVANNVSFNNGGRGITVYESQNAVIMSNSASTNNQDPHATVYSTSGYGGYEIGARDSTNISFESNEAQAFSETCNGTNQIYAFVDDPGASSSSDTFTSNTGFAVYGTNNLVGYSATSPSAYYSTLSGYSFGTTNQ